MHTKFGLSGSSSMLSSSAPSSPTGSTAKGLDLAVVLTVLAAGVAAAVELVV